MTQTTQQKSYRAGQCAYSNCSWAGVDLLRLRAQYTSKSALFESVLGKELPYINLTINLYDSYVAELRLELVFPDLQSDALPTALSRSACIMIMSDCKVCVVI